MDVIEEVSTLAQEAVSVVNIRLSAYSTYKVVPVTGSEILIAFRDTRIAGEVYGAEAVFGDALVERIETVANPGGVACVVVKVAQPLEQIRYQVKESKGQLRLELSHKGEAAVTLKGRSTEGGGRVDEAVSSSGRQGETVAEKPRAVWIPTEKDLPPDQRLLNEAIDYFEQEKWANALSVAEELMASYPESSRREAAAFLAAKSFHRSWQGGVGEHLLEISERFQTALNAFPNSSLIPDALVSLGNCYLEAGQYFEAMSYYDRVLNEFQGSDSEAEAMYQRGRVFALTEKPLMALRYFETLEKQFSHSSFAAKAKLERAKTLFDIKSFKRSLQVLDEISSTSPDQVYAEPDVLLYAGYNYYELGQLNEAREALSRALNYFPELENKDLLLARIGDTYREDGMEDRAAKLYDFVARTYPESEGSMISLLRVAEGKEKTGMTAQSGENQDGEDTSVKEASAIYRQIAEKSPDSPLAQVATLKLAAFQKKNREFEAAIGTLKKLLAKKPDKELKEEVDAALEDAMFQLAVFQKNEKSYEKSVETLKGLISQYPTTGLKDEITAVLDESLGGAFEAKSQAGKTEGLINYYESLKRAIPFDALPNRLLQVGDAYRQLHLYGHALSVLKGAQKALGPKGLPSRALLNLGESAFKEKRFDEAEAALKEWVRRYPKDRGISSAYFWLGKTYLERGEFDSALVELKHSLDGNRDPELHGEILSAMAEAATGRGNLSEAAQSLEQVAALLEKKEGGRDGLYSVYRRLGGVHSKMGNKEMAVHVLEKALALEPPGAQSLELQYQLAQCYQGMNASEKAQTLLNRIAASGDPFWSRLARAQIDEIQIGQSVQQLGLGSDQS